MNSTTSILRILVMVHVMASNATAFLMLRYFSVVDNVVVDIMHDLLEGVAQYEVKLLFDSLAKNFLSSEHILLRIYGYSYGYLDRKNRPTKINIHGNGLGLNASQTMSCEKPSTHICQCCSRK